MTSKSEKHEFIISEGLLAAVGSLLGVELNAMSPLRYGDDHLRPDTIGAKLCDAGLLDSDGQIRRGKRKVFEVLAKANWFVRVRIIAGRGLTELYLYADTATGETASIQTREGGVAIGSPGLPEEIIAGVRTIVGESPLCSSDLDVSLPAGEALVVSALIDLVRKRGMRAFIETEDVEEIAIPVGEIGAELATEHVHSQRMVSILARISDVNLPSIDEAKLPEVLSSLAERELIEFHDGVAKPGSSLAALANGLVKIDRVFTIAAGREANGNVRIGGFAILQGGVSDLLIIDVGDEAVITFRSISPLGMMSLISKMVTDFELIAVPADPTAASADDPGFTRCPSCGAATLANMKFCSGCGSPLTGEREPEPEVEASFCTECGATLEAGSKFCTECGTQLGEMI